MVATPLPRSARQDTTDTVQQSKLLNKIFHLQLGGGGVQGQGKGQRLMSNIAVNDYIWLATCQGRIYEK